MSFNPQTGLVYIPAQGVPLKVPRSRLFKHNAQEPGKSGRRPAGTSASPSMPPHRKSRPFGSLLAWDPVKQKEAWRAEYVAPWNGGTLTTAGNLVFQGTADGRFIAYNATTGEKLWETPVGTGVVAAASTYTGRRQAICVDRGRLGRRVRIALRATECEPRNGLHLRGRRQGAAAGFREVPDGRRCSPA